MRRRRERLSPRLESIFVVLAIVMCAGIAQGPAGAATYLAGIDVSHWQGTIDWNAVAHDPQNIKFAIIKATEGQTYLDPNYATNRSGAQAAGLKTAAYHFARPDTTTNDGKLEADWFIDNAHISQGDIIPALDIEVNGGLTPQALINWTQQWLGEVFTVTGVKPMIYSNPSFWTNSLANTTQFADEGYATLWIAHWTSASQPTVPASNWGGHGWTFWQWTDNDTVSGISGAVDADRYNGTDLTRVLVPSMVQRLSPINAPQGVTSAGVTVTGATFRAGVTVTMSGAGVTVNSTTLNGPTSLTLSLTVDPSAPVGPRDVTATNTDGTTGTCYACFSVAQPNNAVTTGGFGAGGTNVWDLVNRNQAGIASDQHLVFSYGSASDTAIVGDWNGAGMFTPGVVRGNTWYLRNTNDTGPADTVFSYGSASDVKVVGDWDGNGTWTPGVVRGNTWYLRNSNTTGAADIVLKFGSAGDRPVVGDWDGDGTFTPGIVRGTVWYLRNSTTSGVADVAFNYGNPGDVPVPGDWDGDGTWTPGVYRPSTGRWYLQNVPGGFGVSFQAPSPGKLLAGDWDGADPA